MKKRLFVLSALALFLHATSWAYDFAVVANADSAVTWNTLETNGFGYSELKDNNPILSALDDLGEQHKKFLTETNNLYKTFQALNLNDKEFEPDGIVPKYMALFDNVIADYNMNGNVGEAYNNLMALTRKMYSSPDLIGRIRANADYENFKKKVEDNKTLPQAYKNWLLETNQYYYNDGALDKNGNPTYGEPGKPKREPVDHVGFDGVVERALKFVQPTTGTIQGGYFLTVQGRPVTEIGKSKDGKIYRQNIEGEREAISSENVYDAITALISSDPAIKASLQQDYAYEQYDYGKQQDASSQEGNDENMVVNGITDSNVNCVNDFNAWLKYKIGFIYRPFR